jgi:NAD dependent epimerase/dehydratase family enzyme
MPWIHIDDLCGMYLQAILNPTMEGAYNAAILDITTNIIFLKLTVYLYSIVAQCSCLY